jgi:hypothetical protein
LSFPHVLVDINLLSGGLQVEQRGQLSLLDLYVIDIDNNCLERLIPQQVSDEAQRIKIDINRQKNRGFLF